MDWQSAQPLGGAGFATLSPKGFSGGAQRGPIYSDGNVSVALDGVLDNRGELIPLLQAGDLDTGDPGLIAEAYHRWGADCSKHLIGEYVFVVWDERRQRLVASRDAFGTREIFYSIDEDWVQLGSQVWQLKESVGLKDLNPEFLSGMLACGIVIDGSTPLKGVERLKAGETLVVEGRNVRTLQAWSLSEDVRSSACNEPQEYVERFAELFHEAVELCLETPGRVSAELSGGLDSSAIVAVAAKSLSAEDGNWALPTVTLTWPETTQSDESAWARLVARETGVENVHVPCESAFFDQAISAAELRSEPHFGILCFPMHTKEVEAFRQLNTDVLLSGSRAEAVVLDQLPPIHLADQLRQGQFRQLWKDIPKWQEHLCEPLLNVVSWYCLRPLFTSRSLEESIDGQYSLPPFLDVRFARETEIESRVGPHRPKVFSSPAMQHQFEMLGHSEQMLHRGYVDLAFECRYPFLYRPLVDHCFSTPWEVKHQPGRPKTLLREGLKHVLPDQVTRRQGSTSPTYAALKTLQRNPDILRDLEDPILAEIGAVDRDRWNQALKQLRHGRCYDFAGFTTCIATEYWIRAHCIPKGLRE